jgi:hypothetical protein
MKILVESELDQDDYDWVVMVMDAMSVVLETISEKGN